MVNVFLVVAVVVVIAVATSMRRSNATPFGDPRTPTARDQPSGAQSHLGAKLREWVGAGLIDPDQASAVERYEAEHAPDVPSRVPLAAEAIGYIGAGLVVAAVALVVGNRWDDLTTTGRIVSLTIPTLAAIVAGWWTGGREEPALERLGSVLWLLAVAGTAGVAAVVWIHAIHDGSAPDHGTTLFVGGIALCFALTAWLLRPLEFQQIAMLGATIATVLGIIDALNTSRDASMSSLAVGLSLFFLGAAWLAGGTLARLPPTILASLSGSILILVGAQIIRNDNDHLALWLGLASAVALMVVGVARSEIQVLLVGTVGLFQWTPQIALFYLEDTLGAEATLFVIGTLFIVLAGLLTRLYPWVKARHGNNINHPPTPTPVG